MKGYSIHWLKDVNLSFKCCRASLNGTLSGIPRFLCKSQLDLTGRIATDYGKTSGKITFQWHFSLSTEGFCQYLKVSWHSNMKNCTYCTMNYITTPTSLLLSFFNKY